MKLISTIGLGFMALMTSAVSQTTLGELQAFKPVKTPKQVIEERVTGSKQDTTTAAGSAAQISYEAGGVARSVVQTLRMGPRQFTGKWWAEEGKSCVQFLPNPENCIYWFTTDAGIFQSRSETDPAAPVRKGDDR